MVAKVTQTKANGQNLFEISNSTGVLFYAKTPWMNLNLPFNLENIQQLIMMTKSGEVAYTTSYSVVENVVEGAIPLKFLWSDGQRFLRYSIVNNDEIRGSFYARQDGFWDSKFVIENNGRQVIGYDIGVGKIRALSLYENGVQICQITKPLSTINNLDIYYIHLLDEDIDLLPVLSFFVIYYDYLKYNRAGEFVYEKIEINREYTYDANNKYYNPDWIEQHFGKAESDRFKEEINQYDEAAKKRARRIVKIVFLGFGIALVVAGIFLLVLFLLL